VIIRKANSNYSLKNNIKTNDKIRSPVIDLAYFNIRQNLINLVILDLQAAMSASRSLRVFKNISVQR